MNERTVLVVEDESDVQNALKQEFERSGFEVHLAMDTTGALEALHEKVVDIVVLDMKMDDDVAGIKVLRAASYYGLTRNCVPIVVFTAWPSYENCVEAMRAGARYYMAKSADNVENSIRELVRRCKTFLEEVDEAAKPPSDDWLAENYASLIDKYGGKRIAVLDRSEAEGCEWEQSCELGNHLVVASDSFESLREELMKKPKVRRCFESLKGCLSVVR